MKRPLPVWLIAFALVVIAVVVSPLSAQNPFTLYFGTSPSSVQNGVTDAGTQRVTISSDSTGQVTANAGTGPVTAWKVDGSGVTQPVSGTFWQATQPVSAVSLPLPTGASTSAKQPALGTAGSASADVITVQGIASMTALKVDGSAVTQPISAASLPLPTGASTSAKQPALGTAGTPSADVITVQGATSMTALKVDGSGVTQPISIASAQVASGAYASGAFASGSVASGAFASGSLAAGACAVGCLPPASGALVKGTVTSAMTGTTSTQVIAAVASNYIYVTSCHFSNTHASVTTMENLQDGSGGTTIWTGINPFGSGNDAVFPTPLKVPTLGNGLYVANVTTGSNTFVSCQGFSSTTSY